MSEFRQDPPSGDWVIVAPGRAGRPSTIEGKKQKRERAPKRTCPFEDLKKSGNWPPLIAYPNEKNWRVVLLPNKYPALAEHGKTCSAPFHEGMYNAITGVGFHELVVTRDHDRQLADLDSATAGKVMQIFQDRCRWGANDPCIVYVVPFYNFGKKAGASIWHPHYQILGLPVVPPHTGHSLEYAETYFKKHRRCIRCETIAEDRKDGRRVIAENRNAIAIAPYGSKLPFEVRVLPKKHEPYFYKSSTSTVRDVTALVQTILKSMKRELGDPDLNFFIHEAPLDKRRHDYHHWHVEIFPRVSVPAGFEFSTGIYINTAAPEDSAAILRGESGTVHGHY